MPINEKVDDVEVKLPVSLRDYFAAKALTGYLAAHAGDGVELPEDSRAACRAYKLADAMLVERNKQS